MKHWGLCVLLLVSFGSVCRPAGAVDQALPYGPDQVLLNQLENEYEPVPFAHAAHAKMAQMWNGCTTCHHRQPQSEPGSDIDIDKHQQENAAKTPQCRTCHPADSQDIDIEQPSLQGAYHRQCLNCHKDWSGANNCGMCHAPKDKAAASTAPTVGDIVGRMHPPLEAPVEKVFIARFTPAAGPKVTFRHQEHVQAFGIACEQCHHRDTCADCHSGEVADGNHRKPVEPAASWRDSHGPCMTCHQDQPCAKCHYDQDASPPPPFDHALTGQTLDDDHADLTCEQCHRSLDFVAQADCGDSACHGQKMVALPKDRPGPQVAPPSTLAAESDAEQTAQILWASLRPRPLRPMHVAMDEALAEKANPAAIVQAAALPVAPPHEPTFDQHTSARMPEPGDASCVTEECHVAVKAFAHQHGPVSVNACDVCHELVDKDKHQFKLLRARKELCTYCHEFDVSNMPVVHEPVQNEECLGCHNPHGSSTRSLMREESVAATCDRCHESFTRTSSFLHSPVHDGECITCHAPHASRLANLLDAVGSDLCLTCHQEFGRQLAGAAFTHEALKEQCERCHDPHGSDQPLSLVAAVPQLCYDCHEQTYNTVTQAAFRHSGAVQDKQSCDNCHTPHGGNLAGLLRDVPQRLCLTCHDEPVQTPDGRTVAAVPQLADLSLHGHGPMSDGLCEGCHQPHGSMNANLLTQSFSNEPRQLFAVENYAFCFQCHDAGLVVQQAPQEQPVTRFRNGQTNLHALHVNDRWGRSCTSCHRRHVSDNTKLIRTSLQFKNWETDIGFRETENGGFCLAGCHVPLSYDRVNPVAFDSRIDKEPPAPIRSAPPAPIRFTARDTAGDAITVPGDGSMNIIIALRCDSVPDAKSLAPLIAVLRDAKQARILVLVSGADAPAAAANLLSLYNAWQIVPDEKGELNNELNIHGWPLVLMVDHNGRELARLGGVPLSLAIRLQGYLDAAMNPGQSSPPKPVAAIVDDGQKRRVDQYLGLASQLRQQNHPQQAKKVLTEALELHPDEVELQLALAQTLMDLDQPEQALTRLAMVQPDASRSDKRNLLQARALVALDRWDEAQVLAEPLVQNKDLQRDAYLLLGRIYEHAERWREAAEAYRLAQQP